MVEIATVMFVAVEVPLQYETTQLLSIVNGAGAGLTTEIPVFHSDGTALARVRGALLFLTKEGEKTGLNLRFPQGMAVCELEGRTLLAHCRAGAAALQASAELQTPDGAFVRCSEGLEPVWLSLARGNSRSEGSPCRTAGSKGSRSAS